MVIGGELGCRRHLPAQQAAGQRQAHDDGHVLRLGPWQHGFEGLLPEQVEDDLQRTAPFLVQADQRLVHGFHAGAECPDLALGPQLAQPLEDVPSLQHRRGDAVQLRQVQRVPLQPPQGGLRRGAHPGLGVVVGIQGTAAELGGDEDVLAAVLPQEAADQRLAPAVAVNVGGVEEVHPGVQRRGEDGERGIVVHVPPVGPAELPAAEADLGNQPFAAVEKSCVHVVEIGSGGEIRRTAGSRGSPPR